MILGIGVDVVHIDRIRHWLEIPGLPERFFSAQELSAVRDRGGSAALSLAARFAAKEAFGKAIGTGLAGMTLKEIEVANNHNGRPDIRLVGSALHKLTELGGRKVHVSLTHEHDNAIAMVVIED